MLKRVRNNQVSPGSFFRFSSCSRNSMNREGMNSVSAYVSEVRTFALSH